jgi:hypothetical protein
LSNKKKDQREGDGKEKLIREKRVKKKVSNGTKR